MKQVTGASTNRHWLFSGKLDMAGLFLPVWCCWLICFLLPENILQEEFPLWAWIAIILFIDVSHVWSTLFKTYLDKESRMHHAGILKAAPFLSLLGAFALASASELWFWRVLAYLALFHFIKQQYGFLALYKAKHKDRIQKRVFKDKWVIYFSMIYPVLYWHLMPERHFNWFMEGDFMTINGDGPWWPIAHLLYFIILISWFAEELWQHKKQGKAIVIGKSLWLLTTALNWYLGIVYFNSDIAFSLTNVVAHGIPYMILIIFFTQKKEFHLKGKTNPLKRTFTIVTLVAFLALVEEYFWDMLVNRDKQTFFESLIHYPMAAFEQPYLRALAIAILIVPQSTHYILDAYIWKKNDKNPFLKLITH